MILNLDDVGKLVRVKDGTALELASDKRRTVTLIVNCEAPTQFRLLSGVKDDRYLCTVEGYHTIKFIADGPVAVFPTSDGEVWWWCPELESGAIEVDVPSTFTTVVERKPRNVEMDRMLRKAQENMERRFAQMFGQMSVALDEAQAENNALKAEGKRRGKSKPAGAVSASGGSESGETAASGGARGTEQEAEGGNGDAVQ